MTALGSTSPKLSRPHLQPVLILLTDKDWVVRQQAVECISALFPGHGAKGAHRLTKPAQAALVVAATHDPKPEIRKAATDLLKYKGFPVTEWEDLTATGKPRHKIPMSFHPAHEQVPALMELYTAKGLHQNPPHHLIQRQRGGTKTTNPPPEFFRSNHIRNHLLSQVFVTNATWREGRPVVKEFGRGGACPGGARRAKTLSRMGSRSPGSSLGPSLGSSQPPTSLARLWMYHHQHRNQMRQGHGREEGREGPPGRVERSDRSPEEVSIPDIPAVERS